MELAYAFFARAARVTEDGLEIRGGELPALLGALPYTAEALTLVAKLEFQAEECGRSYLFQVQVTNPKCEAASLGSLEVTPPHPRQQNRLGAIVLFDLTGMTFAYPGTFQYRVLVNGVLLDTLELMMIAEESATESTATA